MLASGAGYGQTTDVVSATPYTFPDRVVIVDGRTTCNKIGEMSFREYIEGVVRQEIEKAAVNDPTYGLSNAQKVEALKAQALAAQTAYVALAQCNDNCSQFTEPDVESSQRCQVWTAGPYSANDQAAVSAVDVSSRILTLNGSAVGAQFFDSTDSGFTINEEIENGTYVATERKNITPEFVTGSTSVNRLHGMSQVGDVTMAGPGATFGQGHSGILQHYYGPMCPIMVSAKITQNSQVKYQHSWSDNNNFTAANIAAPGPTRTISPGPALSQRALAPLGANSDAKLEIEFNEQVASPGSGIQVDVGGQTLTGGTRLRPAPDGLPEKWTFMMSSAFLQTLPGGQNTVTVTATNRFAANLAIDSDPSSMAFRGYDGTLTGCQSGGDTFVSFEVTNPRVAVAKNGDPIQFLSDGSYDRPTTGQDVTIYVEDLISSSGTLGGSLARLDILSSSGTVLATNSTEFPLSHVYTSKDDGLSILAQLPPDILTVVATDLAGSTTTAQIFVDTQAFAVLDSSGIVVPDAGATSSGTVTLHGDANTYTLLLDGPTAFDPLVFTSTDPPLGDYDGLTEGVYTASALDINNVLISSQTFVVDFTPPVVTAAGGDGLAIAPGGSTNSSILKLTVSDPLSGAAEIDVPSFDPYLLTGDTTPVTVEFDGILSDSNTVTVYDRAGNASVFNFVGANHLPFVSMTSTSGVMSFGFVAGDPPPGADLPQRQYDFTAIDPTGGTLGSVTTNASLGTCLSASTETDCHIIVNAPGNYFVSVSA